MKQYLRITVLILAAVLALGICAGSLAETAATCTDVWPAAPTYTDRYWKQDSSKTEGLPSGYRAVEDGIRTDATVTDLEALEAGMADDNMSGSGEFSAACFAAMIDDIRSRTDAVVCVFDLRQETHGFADGMPVSLYGSGNAANAGLDTPAVLALEQTQLNKILRTRLTLTQDKGHGKPKPGEDGGKKEKKPEDDSEKSESKSSETKTLDVTNIMTEAELCASLGVEYVRIACTDHLCPTDENVDEFMAAYLALPEDAWLHFHCAAGVGRTGLFMMMTDQLRNPDLDMETIITRQVLIGANDPRDSMESESQESNDKLDLLQRFHDYVQECGPEGYTVNFSDWSAARAK